MEAKMWIKYIKSHTPCRDFKVIKNTSNFGQISWPLNSLKYLLDRHFSSWAHFNLRLICYSLLSSSFLSSSMPCSCSSALCSVFRWGTHLYMSLFPSVCLSVGLSICCAPYLRNLTSSDHNFWYTYVKWSYFQMFFFIFLKFCFLGLLGG